MRVVLARCSIAAVSFAAVSFALAIASCKSPQGSHSAAASSDVPDSAPQTLNYQSFLPSEQDLANQGPDLTEPSTALLQTRFEESKKEALFAEDEPSHIANFYFGVRSLRRRVAEKHEDWAEFVCDDDGSFCDKESHRRARLQLESVTDLQLGAMAEYSEFFYQKANGFLRRPEKISPVEEASIRAVISGLMRLPPLEGGSKLYRCDNALGGGDGVSRFVRRVFQASSKGSLQLERAFHSTTRGRSLSSYRRFVNDCTHLRIITTKANGNAREFFAFSTRPREDEVLFLPNTYFKVTEFEERQAIKKTVDWDTGKLVETEEKFTQKVLYLTEH